MGIVGAVLALIGIGVVILIALAVWQIIRSVRGLERAINGQPIENPTGWL